MTVDPLDGGRRSRVTIELDFSGHGIGKLIVPIIVRPQARAEMSANMRQLKQRLEGAINDDLAAVPRHPPNVGY